MKRPWLPLAAIIVLPFVACATVGETIPEQVPETPPFTVAPSAPSEQIEMAIEVAPVTVMETADRGVMITYATEPPPDPRAIVNSLPYQHYNPEPAMQAYRIVASVNGWSDDKIASWEPFVYDLLQKESGFCWNRLRGDVMIPYSMCVQERQGRHEDAGFGQLISVHYGPGKWLCVDHGICDKWTIISEPWISMEVVILLLDRSGSQPWCYDASARRYHDCWKAPDR